MNKETLMSMLVIMLLLGGAIAVSHFGGRSTIKNLEKQVAAKQAQMATLAAERDALKKDYMILVKKLEEKTKQRKTVRPPSSEVETLKRFGSLGYVGRIPEVRR